MDLRAWVNNDVPFELIHPTSEGDWKGILEYYVGSVTTKEFRGVYHDVHGTSAEVSWTDSESRRRNIEPLRRVLKLARDAGCRSVLVEHRYVDPDYRSEYSAFWSLKFGALPAFARRLHFFKTGVKRAQVHCLETVADDYLGYSVLRPVPQGPVGRTLLVPPETLKGPASVMVEIEDDVSVFGAKLHVRGVPFSQQDGEFIRCAQAAVWACHYMAFRKRLIGRKTTGELAKLAPPLLSADRPLPSNGLNTPQIQAVFSESGQPALMYRLGLLPTVLGVNDPIPPERPPVNEQKTKLAEQKVDPGCWDDRVITICCRYLNSGIPILVATGEHAFVLVGYRMDDSKVTFIASDDQEGPYLEIPDPLTDDRGGAWEEIMVPLPPKVFMTAESAENSAYETLSKIHEDASATQHTREVHEAFARGELQLRTLLLRGRDYKERLQKQHRYPDVVRNLRLARLSNWIWVVEVHDRHCKEEDEPYVKAEFVYDSTSYNLEPRRLAASYPDVTTVLPPNGGRRRYANTGDQTSWWSHLDVRMIEA